MGLFDFFSGKKKQPLKNEPQQVAVDVVPDKKHLLEEVEVMPGLKIPRAFALRWPEIAQSKLPAISITATSHDELALEQSKFGYYPCMPLDFEYPRDASGQFMYPLAQVNFRETPPLQGYPRSGYLQFYISATSDLYGADFDNPLLQKDFRVLFFEENEVEKYKADFSFLDETMASETLPLNKPYALAFSPKDDYAGMGDVRHDDNETFNLHMIIEQHPEIDDELGNAAFDSFSAQGHKIGGYANFTQTDPRSYKPDYMHYILLLQIDTDDDIMWGDSGVGNFFIHPDDLAKMDFSKVMYTWDCC